MARILVVDDEQPIRQLFQDLLEDEGHDVTTAENGSEALKRMQESHFHIALMDIKMKGMDGLEVLKRTKRLSLNTEVVIMTGFASVDTAVEAMKLGAYDYIKKPISDIQRVKVIIEKSLEKNALFSQNEYLRQEVEGKYSLGKLIGRSEQMQQIYEVIQRMADSWATVLIQGKSGTGKSLVARAIHFNSPRRGASFIPINCGALSESLLESELFGHEKGAFTGATVTKPGLFEIANKGTFFLDEIGETSSNFQVKLLRVLDDRKIKRVGGTKPIKVDIRIIAATNKDLKKAMAQGSFRDDLFYRLNVISLRMPSLKERGEDIPLLAEHFLEKYNRETRKKVRSISREAMGLLVGYDWPGNVRELENIIERAVALDRKGLIIPEDLPGEFQEKSEDKIRNIPLGNISYKEAKKQVMEDFDRKFLEESLRRAEGNISRAARAIHMARRNFQQKMRQYHLDARKHIRGEVI